MLIDRNNLEFVQTIKRWLLYTFEMNDMGKSSYILGVKIHRIILTNWWLFHKNTILRKYLNDLICKIIILLTLHL